MTLGDVRKYRIKLVSINLKSRAGFVSCFSIGNLPFLTDKGPIKDPGASHTKTRRTQKANHLRNILERSNTQ